MPLGDARDELAGVQEFLAEAQGNATRRDFFRNVLQPLANVERGLQNNASATPEMRNAVTVALEEAQASAGANAWAWQSVRYSMMMASAGRPMPFAYTEEAVAAALAEFSKGLPGYIPP